MTMSEELKAKIQEVCTKRTHDQIEARQRASNDWKVQMLVRDIQNAGDELTSEVRALYTELGTALAICGLDEWGIERFQKKLRYSMVRGPWECGWIE